MKVKIKHLLKNTDNSIAFIEFISEDGKSKILSYENFIKRYGKEIVNAELR